MNKECHRCDVRPCDHELAWMFDECLDKYRECRQQQHDGGSAIFVESPTLCSRRAEEFMADFEIVCRRSLESKLEQFQFKRLISGVIKSIPEPLMSRLGLALSTVEPYPVSTPFKYFHHKIRTRHGSFLDER